MCFSEKPGVIQFERKSLKIRENIDVLQITVLRVGGTDGTLIVNYKAVAGTAIALTDFILSDGELVFKEGVDKLTITIKIVNDRIKEDDKTFSVLLYGQSKILGGITSISITIIDDDGKIFIFLFNQLLLILILRSYFCFAFLMFY